MSNEDMTWSIAKNLRTDPAHTTCTVIIYPQYPKDGENMNTPVSWGFRVRANNGENLDPEGHSDPRDAWRAFDALSRALEYPRLVIWDTNGEIIHDSNAREEEQP